MNVNPRNAWEVAPVNETEIEPMASAWRPLWPGHNDALELRQSIWMSAGNPHKFNFVDEVEGTLRYRHCLYAFSGAHICTKFYYAHES